MIGGYMSFAGAHGSAGYGATVLADVLPVRLALTDDRTELPTGAVPVVVGEHQITSAAPRWDEPFLGYNKVAPREGAQTLLAINDDPLLVVGAHGRGRTAAFTSDCAPHWCPHHTATSPAQQHTIAKLVDWLG